MKVRILGFMAVVAAFSVSGCGLSEASAEACTAGKKQGKYVQGMIESGPPEIMVTLAEGVAPEFKERADDADDEDVKAAFTKLSQTFTDFSPDMSKRPTALQQDPEFERYIEEFKTSVRDQLDELDAVCS
ncbi:hypothetical protein [Actinophytocola sediminis]